jgi:hypothetical protein
MAIRVTHSGQCQITTDFNMGRWCAPVRYPTCSEGCLIYVDVSYYDSGRILGRR